MGQVYNHERLRNHRASLRAEDTRPRSGRHDEAGDGLCWVRLTRFGDDWLLIRSNARDVSRAVRKFRQIPAGEQSDRFPEVGP